MSEELQSGVAGVLADLGEIGSEDEVELTPIAGGASRETWLVESGDRKYVLRRDPEGAEGLVSQDSEQKLVGLAGRAGAPVPEILSCEPAGGPFGTAGNLMRHIKGESVAPRILRRDEFAQARERLPVQLAEALAGIHAIAPGDAAEAIPRPEGDPAELAITSWEAELDRIGEPFPAIELGLRWLRLHRPDPVEPRLVHGDFRLGNFIVDESGLAAVIDWELAHLGDPAEDIGWLCIRSWRFGNDGYPIAGLGTLDEFLAAYEAAGGEATIAERVRYWEVFGNVKWAVICARQADDHLSGLRRSHELASLGRRVCEPEWDALELIGTAA